MTEIAAQRKRGFWHEQKSILGLPLPDKHLVFGSLRFPS
jgi:hypothetical protein